MLQEGFAYGGAFLFFCPAAFTMCPQAKNGRKRHEEVLQ